jgi:hypothetical protein
MIGAAVHDPHRQLPHRGKFTRPSHRHGVLLVVGALANFHRSRGGSTAGASHCGHQWRGGGAGHHRRRRGMSRGLLAAEAFELVMTFRALSTRMS